MRSRVHSLVYKIRKDYLTRENSFVIIVFVFLFFWSASSVVAMERNWQQQRYLEAQRVELVRLQVEVSTLGLEQLYLESEEYQELAARKRQNRMLPGETMLRLPPNSETARNKFASDDELAAPRLSNPQQWLRFLLP